MCAIGNSSTTSIGGSASTSTLLGDQTYAGSSGEGVARNRSSATGARGTVLTGPTSSPSPRPPRGPINTFTQ
jgi:hypothetical protein